MLSGLCSILVPRSRTFECALVVRVPICMPLACVRVLARFGLACGLLAFEVACVRARLCASASVRQVVCVGVRVRARVCARARAGVWGGAVDAVCDTCSHSSPQANLGLMYEKGWGVPSDVAEAVRWYAQSSTSSQDSL